MATETDLHLNWLMCASSRKDLKKHQVIVAQSKKNFIANGFIYIISITDFNA